MSDYLKGSSVDEELDIGEVDVDCVVMPFSVVDLIQGPTPFSGFEHILIVACDK